MHIVTNKGCGRLCWMPQWCLTDPSINGSLATAMPIMEGALYACGGVHTSKHFIRYNVGYGRAYVL